LTNIWHYVESDDENNNILEELLGAVGTYLKAFKLEWALGHPTRTNDPSNVSSVEKRVLAIPIKTRVKIKLKTVCIYLFILYTYISLHNDLENGPISFKLSGNLSSKKKKCFVKGSSLRKILFCFNLYFKFRKIEHGAYGAYKIKTKEYDHQTINKQVFASGDCQ